MSVRAIAGHAVSAPRLASSSQEGGRLLAYAVTEQCVCVRHVADPAAPAGYCELSAEVVAVGLHPQVPILAVACADGTVTAFDVELCTVTIGGTAARRTPRPLWTRRVLPTDNVGPCHGVACLDHADGGWSIVCGWDTQKTGGRLIHATAGTSFDMSLPVFAVARVKPGVLAVSTGTSVSVGTVGEGKFVLTACHSIKELKGTRFVDVKGSAGLVIALTNAGFMVAFDPKSGAVEKWMDCKVCPAVHLEVATDLVFISGNVLRCFDEASWTFLGKVNPIECASAVSQSFFSGLLAPPIPIAVRSEGSCVLAFNPAGELVGYAVVHSMGMSSSSKGKPPKPKVEYRPEPQLSAFLMSPPHVPCHLLASPLGHLCWVTSGSAQPGCIADGGVVSVRQELAVMGNFVPQAACVLSAFHFVIATEMQCLVLIAATGTVVAKVSMNSPPLAIAPVDDDTFIVVDAHGVAVVDISQGECNVVLRADFKCAECVGAVAVDGVLCVVTTGSVRCWPIPELPRRGGGGTVDESILAGDTDGNSGTRLHHHLPHVSCPPVAAKHRALWADGTDVVAFDPIRGNTARLPTGLDAAVCALHPELEDEMLAAASPGEVAIVCLRNAVTLHKVPVPSRAPVLGVAIIAKFDALIISDALGRAICCELLCGSGGAASATATSPAGVANAVLDHSRGSMGGSVGRESPLLADHGDACDSDGDTVYADDDDDEAAPASTSAASPEARSATETGSAVTASLRSTMRTAPKADAGSSDASPRDPAERYQPRAASSDRRGAMPLVSPLEDSSAVPTADPTPCTSTGAGITTAANTAAVPEVIDIDSEGYPSRGTSGGRAAAYPADAAVDDDEDVVLGVRDSFAAEELKREREALTGSGRRRHQQQQQSSLSSSDDPDSSSDDAGSADAARTGDAAVVSNVASRPHPTGQPPSRPAHVDPMSAPTAQTARYSSTPIESQRSPDRTHGKKKKPVASASSRNSSRELETRPAAEDRPSTGDTTLNHSVATLRQHVGRARHFDPVGREALARELREMASGLDGLPSMSQSFEGSAAHGANVSVGSSIAVAEVTEMRTELRRLRDENMRISRQNDEILSMLRSMSLSSLPSQSR